MARIALILCVLAVPGLADVNGARAKVQDCYCTDKQGKRIELGQHICMQVDGRLFLAQCQMSLNVPMWREIQSNCVTS